MDFVVHLNYNSAIARQNGRCYLCGKKLGEINYYNLDQEKGVNEVYCVECANKKYGFDE